MPLDYDLLTNVIDVVGTQVKVGRLGKVKLGTVTYDYCNVNRHVRNRMRRTTFFSLKFNENSTDC